MGGTMQGTPSDVIKPWEGVVVFYCVKVVLQHSHDSVDAAKLLEELQPTTYHQRPSHITRLQHQKYCRTTV